MGRPIWRKAASVIYSYCWSSSVQSFPGLCPGSHDHILLLQFWGSPRLERKVPVFISPRNRMAQLYGFEQNESEIYLTTDGQSACLSCYQAAIWDPSQRFLSLPWKLTSDIWGFFNMEHPLWREDGSVTHSYNCYWALTMLSLRSKSRRTWDHILLSCFPLLRAQPSARSEHRTSFLCSLGRW
jgi:hypothetical protein